MSCSIVETAGIFSSRSTSFYHPFRRKYLIGFLRRNIVENVLGMAFVEVVCQLLFFRRNSLIESLKTPLVE